MELKRFRGTAVALVTPFKASGVVDEAALARHVEWCIEGGVDVLVPCGTTGESATLSAEEQRQVIAHTVQTAAGRAAVMAGAGGNNTADVVRRARAAREAGADGILSVSPYYNKPTPDGLYAHYRAIAEEAELPVFVYNVPGRTASNIRPDTLFRLAEIENVVGVKEASGDIEQIMAVLAGRPDGFLVLSGDDALTLAVLALGGDGVVSVVANEAPDLMSGLVRAALTGDLARARELHYRLLPLMQANFVETNPIPVKSALEIMGRMPAHFRLPLVPPGEGSAAVLREALEQAGLLG
jgi:4-hydroxy-tetrahydrodipicolinate synthase